MEIRSMLPGWWTNTRTCSPQRICFSTSQFCYIFCFSFSKCHYSFIQRCIAKPLPGLEPCLPSILIIQCNLRQHTAGIKSFLDTLPKEFSWAVESEAASSFDASPSSLFSYDITLSAAEESKRKGNVLYTQRDRLGAINAYSDAINRLMNALRSDPNREKNKGAEKLLAVCCANRAAAYLLPGQGVDRGSDLHDVWKDGELAIRADPSYAKGYVFLTKFEFDVSSNLLLFFLDMPVSQPLARNLGIRGKPKKRSYVPYDGRNSKTNGASWTI